MHKRFTVYRSSAGSGKTFTLVKEYLKLALGSENPSRYAQILALTFTNKAANEMKERVIKSLHALAKAKPDSDDPMFDLIRKDLGLSTEVLGQRASATLRHVLHNYSIFSISTIDKFVHRIIKSFSKELGVSADFEVETDVSEIISTAAKRVIGRAGKNQDLTDLLVDFAASKAEEEKDWNIESDITMLAEQALKEDGLDHLEQLETYDLSAFIALRKKLQAELIAFKKAIVKIGSAGCELIEKTDLQPSAFAGGERAGIGKYFSYLSNFKVDKLQPSNSLQGYVAENKWVAAKADEIEKKKIEAIAGQLQHLFLGAQELIAKEYSDYCFKKLVLESLPVLSLLKQIEEEIQLLKEQRNFILISDFNKKIAAVVLAEPAPFIYERLGERFKNYMIDEFQDTSILQWQNLLPLIENALSIAEPTLLVGDAKQAIYRWRNGEVEQFIQLPKLFASEGNSILKEKERLLEQNYNAKNLNTNFRSAEKIVEFNNQFYRSLKSFLGEDLQSIFQEHEQLTYRKSPKGYVEISALANSSEGAAEDQHMKKLLHTIQTAIEDGYAYRDVAILTRSRAKASDLGAFLSLQQIPVLSPESLLLVSSPKVMLLVNLMRHYADPSDEFIKAQIIRGIAECKLADVTVHTALQNHSQFEADGKRQSAVIDLHAFFAVHGIDLATEDPSQMPVFEMAESMIRKLKMVQHCDGYVQFFLDEVHQFSQKHSGQFQDFLSWWQKNSHKLAVKAPDGIDAVQLLTIHSAKGLEFPVVIVPYAHWSIQPESHLWIKPHAKDLAMESVLVANKRILEKTNYSHIQKKEDSKALLDNINLLYVATTRPTDRLYIYTDEKPKKNSISHYIHSSLLASAHWDAEKQVYRLGSVSQPEEKAHSAAKTTSLKQWISSNWRGRLTVSKKLSASWQSENDYKERLRYGELLHQLLAQIYSESDLKLAIETLKTRQDVEKERHSAIEKKLEDIVLHHKTTRTWFKAGLNVKNEQELISKEGEVLRPDRVILESEKAIVVDYKSGQKRSEHQNQIKRYGEHLVDLGYKIVEMNLVYTDDISIVNVS